MSTIKSQITSIIILAEVPAFCITSSARQHLLVLLLYPGMIWSLLAASWIRVLIFWNFQQEFSVPQPLSPDSLFQESICSLDWDKLIYRKLVSYLDAPRLSGNFRLFYAQSTLRTCACFSTIERLIFTTWICVKGTARTANQNWGIVDRLNWWTTLTGE